jgi:hypothetical protein
LPPADVMALARMSRAYVAAASFWLFRDEAGSLWFKVARSVIARRLDFGASQA